VDATGGESLKKGRGNNFRIAQAGCCEYKVASMLNNY